MRPGLFLRVARVLPRASTLVLASSLVAGRARAGDDLVLDLGGMTLETRPVVHGSFTRGAMLADPVHDRDEEPAHQVTISRDFWMGKFPVTYGQFAKFVTDTRYVTDAEKGQTGGAGWDGKALVQKKDFNWKSPGFTQTDEHPVVLVSYGDASAFVGWASRKTGKRVRLPTEAEWEFAARGGTTTPWYGGSTEAEAATIGWFKGNAGNGTRPVGQKKANPLGLFDMSGNVFEWCRDNYAPYHEAAAIDPEVTASPGSDPERRVLRGGSWLRDVKRARSGARYRNAPSSRNADNGFRVVVTNEEPVAPGVIGTAPEFAPASPLGGARGRDVGPGGASSGSGSLTSGGAGDPMRTDAVPHADGFSWGVLLVSPLAAASAVVAWMLLRRRRSAAGVVAPSGVSARVGDDGFFVRAPKAPPGSRVRYECTVNGTPVTDVVPLAGEETFVYTGSPPSGIRVVEILGAPSAGYRTLDRPPVQASLDAGLLPPSSRPRPPPVPLRLIVEPPSGVGIASSEIAPPSETSRGEASPAEVSVGEASPAAASKSEAPPSEASSPAEAPKSAPPSETSAPGEAAASEVFLGNPRAY